MKKYLHSPRWIDCYSNILCYQVFTRDIASLSFHSRTWNINLWLDSTRCSPCQGFPLWNVNYNCLGWLMYPWHLLGRPICTAISNANSQRVYLLSSKALFLFSMKSYWLTLTSIHFSDLLLLVSLEKYKKYIHIKYSHSYKHKNNKMEHT